MNEDECSGKLRKILPEHNYTPSYWSVSQNHSLSLRALGLHTYLMSLPEDWDISSIRISNDRAEGRDAVRKAMKELEIAGLLEHTKINTDKGHLKTLTHVYALPKQPVENLTAKPQVTPGTENQALVNRAPVNQAPKKKDSYKEITSSLVPTVAGDTEPVENREEEEKKSSIPTTEDFSPGLKSFVRNLDFGDRTPSRAELVRIAKAARRLFGRVDEDQLKRRVEQNAATSRDRVAVYITRLNELVVDDFKPVTRGISLKRLTWCGRSYDCDPNTRHLLDPQGYITNRWCPECSGKPAVQPLVGSTTS